MNTLVLFLGVVPLMVLPGAALLDAVDFRWPVALATGPIVTLGLCWAVLGLGVLGLPIVTPVWFVVLLGPIVLALVLRWRAGRLVPQGLPQRVARRFNAGHLAVVAGGVGAMVIAVLIWSRVLRSFFRLVPLGSDGLNHSLFGVRLAESGRIDLDRVLEAAAGSAGADFYPLALHGFATSVNAVTGLDTIRVLGFMPVVATAVLLPGVAMMIANRLRNGPVVVGLAAPMSLFVPLAWQNIPFGTLTSHVAAILWPTIAIAWQAAPGRRRWPEAVVIAVGFSGLLGLHTVEVVPAALLALGLTIGASGGVWPAVRRLWPVAAIGAVLTMPFALRLLAGFTERDEVVASVVTPTYPGFLIDWWRFFLDGDSLFGPGWLLMLALSIGVIVATVTKVGPLAWVPVVLFATHLLVQYFDNPVSTVARALFYGEPYRVRLLTISFVGPFAALGVVAVVRWLRSKNVTLRLAFTALVVVALSEGVGTSTPQAIAQRLERLAVVQNTVTPERIEAYRFLRDRVEAEPGPVLNEPGSMDGSGWATALEGVDLLNPVEPLPGSEVRADLIELAGRFAWRDVDPAVAELYERYRPRYLLVTFDGPWDRRPPSTTLSPTLEFDFPSFPGFVFDVASLCADRGLEPIFSNDAALIFEVTGPATSTTRNVLEADRCASNVTVGLERNQTWRKLGDRIVVRPFTDELFPTESRIIWKTEPLGAERLYRARVDPREVLRVEVRALPEFRGGERDGTAYLGLRFFDRFSRLVETELVEMRSDRSLSVANVVVPDAASYADFSLIAEPDPTRGTFERPVVRRTYSYFIDGREEAPTVIDPCDERPDDEPPTTAPDQPQRPEGTDEGPGDGRPECETVESASAPQR